MVDLVRNSTTSGSGLGNRGVSKAVELSSGDSGQQKGMTKGAEGQTRVGRCCKESRERTGVRGRNAGEVEAAEI